MSKISIDLDLAVVQKALHAKVQPAVDKILAQYDLSALIVKELEKKAPTSDDAEMRYMVSRMYMMGGSASSGRPSDLEKRR